MDASDVRGLLGSAGKTIANAAASEHARSRLRDVDSREEFTRFLRSVPLGMAKPAREAFIEHVTRESEWRTYHADLVLAVDVAYHNSVSPNS